MNQISIFIVELNQNLTILLKKNKNNYYLIVALV